MCLSLVLIALATAFPGGQDAAGGAQEPWSGKCVGVEDGDTLLVLLGGRRVTVEIATADAPEQGQDYGLIAMATLGAMVDGKTLSVEVLAELGTDHVLANVRLGEKDLALQMVSSGAAWAAPQLPKDDPMFAAEREARAKKLGLWASQNPVPPWDYRASQKEEEFYWDKLKEVPSRSTGLGTVASGIRLATEDGAAPVIDSSHAPPTAANVPLPENDPLGRLGVHLEGYQLRVSEVIGRVEGKGYLVKVSWEARLRNTALEERRAEVEFTIHDHLGNLLFSVTKWFFVPADTIKTFEGYEETTVGAMTNAERFDARLVK